MPKASFLPVVLYTICNGLRLAKIFFLTTFVVSVAKFCLCLVSEILKDKKTKTIVIRHLGYSTTWQTASICSRISTFIHNEMHNEVARNITYILTFCRNTVKVNFANTLHLILEYNKYNLTIQFRFTSLTRNVWTSLDACATTLR